VSKGRRATWIWFLALVALATAVRLAWVLAVRTVPVSDFAMYRESANYLSEFGRLDSGFIYMPGFVVLLAWVKDLGGDLLAQKLLGVGFGGLGAAGLFALVWGLLDRREGQEPDDASGWRRICPSPHAATATLLYAVWPAGVAISSVVGTDMPAAALLVSALGLLVTLAPRRPWHAAIAFGLTMGLTAWVRAVALPLTALAGGYWLARRERLPRAIALTAVGVATTLLVLAPWGIRHLRQSGQLYFTDDHGGITALIGANPNSEGTYTRALNRLFQDVTGKSVLDEPHREVDRAAYAIAREWWRFEPGYALGLAVLKGDRLFDPEHRLLYWPIFRPGVLVGRQALFFARHHDAIVALADGWGLAIGALTLAGLVLAVVQRRFAGRFELLALLPLQLSLVATYTIFFAEPRYRLPIELLAFPFVTLALAGLPQLAGVVRRRERREMIRAGCVVGAAIVLVVSSRLATPALLDAGAALRARHRWAVTEVQVQGGGASPRTRYLMWAPAPPRPATSPIAGAPNGVHLRAGGPTRLRVALGGGPLPAGGYALRMRLETDAPSPATLAIAGVSASVASGAPATLVAPIAHPGGALTLTAELVGAPGATVWVSDMTITAR
jgi:hypothetical protein